MERKGEVKTPSIINEFSDESVICERLLSKT